MARIRPSEVDLDVQIAAAEKRGAEEDAVFQRARGAWYDRGTGHVMVELPSDILVGFPATSLQGLQGATSEQLAEVTVRPGGRGLHWESLGADLLVAPLLAGVFGSRAWMSELGRAGGSVRSQAKAQAARENGKKGGRPKGSGKAASSAIRAAGMTAAKSLRGGIGPAVKGAVSEKGIGKDLASSRAVTVRKRAVTNQAARTSERAGKKSRGNG